MACSCKEQDFCVQAGETWHPTIRWGTGTFTSKPISGVSLGTPAVVTATAHGVPNGWPVAVIGVVGMPQINALRFPPAAGDTHLSTTIDANTVALNDVSSAAFSAYASGGALVYDTPKDMTGASFTLTIYDVPTHDDTPLVTLTSPTAIAVDNVLKTITPTLQTAGITWSVGYFRLLATEASGVVTELLRGTITIDQ